MKTRVIAMTAAVAITACASPDYCAVYCACVGCDVSQQESCAASRETAQTSAEQKGCTAQFDNYWGCVARESTCFNNSLLASDSLCAEEHIPFYACDAGNPDVQVGVNDNGALRCLDFQDATARCWPTPMSTWVCFELAAGTCDWTAYYEEASEILLASCGGSYQGPPLPACSGN